MLDTFRSFHENLVALQDETLDLIQESSLSSRMQDLLAETVHAVLAQVAIRNWSLFGITQAEYDAYRDQYNNKTFDEIAEINPEIAAELRAGADPQLVIARLKKEGLPWKSASTSSSGKTADPK